MRSILLVEPDIDKLGALASELRSRGLNVLLADGADGAVQRSRGARLDALLVSDRIASDALLLDRMLADKELAKLPRFVLIDGAEADTADDTRLPANADAIAKRMYLLAPRDVAVVADKGDFRGDLEQVGIVDLLQLLSMNRRTGVLNVSTNAGAGEVRLVDGQVVDAVYRRLEAEKALYRLIGENEGSFAFAGGAASPMRRVTTATSMLLMEGLRQLDELRRARSVLDADDDALLAIGAPPESASEATRRVVEALTVPLTLDEVIDDVPFPDLEVVEALAGLVQSGIVRRIARGAERVELANAEQLSVLGALTRRLSRPGFSGSARMVLTGSSRQLATVTHSVRRIADAIPPAESVPAAPVPHPLATLRISEGVELEVVGLPLLDAYAPLWSLTLPGAAVVLRLDGASSEALDEVAAVHGIPVLDAVALTGSIDEADPAQIAGLIRSALDALVGRRDA